MTLSFPSSCSVCTYKILVKNYYLPFNSNILYLGFKKSVLFLFLFFLETMWFFFSLPFSKILSLCYCKLHVKYWQFMFLGTWANNSWHQEPNTYCIIIFFHVLLYIYNTYPFLKHVFLNGYIWSLNRWGKTYDRFNIYSRFKKQKKEEEEEKKEKSEWIRNSRIVL